MFLEKRFANAPQPGLAQRTVAALAGRLRHPAMHAALLALITGWCLFISWRKWADLAADFGRELYIPWRLSEGALLYRDVDDFYGPLSQYINAGLFRLFGPGMMVLVGANLLVFTAIVAVLYSLVRVAWTAMAALWATSVFIVVFGFSRAIGTGNFNFATPYSHESTHGMLVLVLLVGLCFRFLQRPSRRYSAACGGLAGLTLVLKPEFVLAGGVVSAMTCALFFMRARGGAMRWFGSWLVGAMAPTLFFLLFFSRHLPLTDAWSAACRAWINVVATTRFVGEPAQIYYLGFDAPGGHLVQHALATGVAIAVIGVVVLVGRISDWIENPGLRWLVTTGLVIGIAALSIGFRLHWLEVGKCLLGLLVVWIGIQVARRIEARKSAPREVGGAEMRVLLGCAAAAMMARMVLNGRVYQFGFFQAALAAVVITAGMADELPRLPWLGSAGRLAVRSAVAALLTTGAGLFALQNYLLYQQVDFPVGEGRDRLFIYGPKYFPQGQVIGNLIGALRNTAPGSRLLVLPEGLMINYLARLPSPLPHFFYYSVVTADGREAELVAKLEQQPPDWVVLTVRDLTEYGVPKWGERSGAGKDLLGWVQAHYESVGAVDGRPMDLARDGALVFRRRKT
jgi:hypothetical protein